jgi:RNA polymerase sigma-70 factor (ECF subfamily)
VDFAAALVEHRPLLLRHCYRMLGSFADAEDLLQDALERAWRARASYRGDAPLTRWLFAIATNACLNALAERRRRALPQLERAPAGDDYVLGELEVERWIGPAPDGRLFPDPGQAAESRETIALAFIALLQRVAPRQRAALLLKDVLGWPADEIATELGLSLASVNSALLRGRKAITRAADRADEPPTETLRELLRAWEAHDLDALVTLLRADVALAMPPHAVWLRGVESVARFFRTPRFTAYWSSGLGLVATRANGLPALAFYRAGERHSIMVARFVDGKVAEMTVFIGEKYFFGFDLPERTVSPPSRVMNVKGDRS